MSIKVPFVNWTINSSKDTHEIQKGLGELKSLELLMNARSHDDFLNSYNIHSRAYNSLFGGNLQWISNNLSELRTIQNKVKDEIFRQGIDVKEKFARKCFNCEAEFDTEEEFCEDCKIETSEPDFEQTKVLDTIMEKANNNGQSLQEVLEQCDLDVEVFDDAWLYLVGQYFYLPNGKLLKDSNDVPNFDVIEFLRGDPLQFGFVVNKEGIVGVDEDDKQIWFCLEHRETMVKAKIGEDVERRCRCEKELVMAYYYSEPVTVGLQGNLNLGGSVDVGKRKYFADWEVKHFSKYSPSLTYGFSPVISVYPKAMMLYHQDQFLMSFFQHERPPKMLLGFKTNNPEALYKSWNIMLDKIRENPHNIWPMALQPDTNGSKGNAMEFVNLMPSLAEMQFTESRNEFRNQMGALYGVTPLFMNDMSNSGGLNNEGLEITVTNRAIEVGQGVINSKPLDFVVKSLQVTDWILELVPSEEQDEAAEKQLFAAEAENATKMASMGWTPVLDDLGESFTYEGEFDREVFASAGSAADPFSPGLFGGAGTGSSAGMTPSGTPAGASTVEMGKDFEKFKGERTLQSGAKSIREELFAELKKFVSEIDFGKRLSRPGVVKKLAELAKRFTSAMMLDTGRELENVYKNSITKVESDLNLDIGFSEVDRNAVEVIKNSRVFKSAFSGFNKTVSSKLNEQIAKAFETPGGFSVDKLVNDMSKVVDASRGSLERIARTESSNISNLARKNSYLKVDETGSEFLYKWIGPSDNRTTVYSKGIKSGVRSEGGAVTMNRLQEIIKQNADPNIYSAQRPFQSHINQRHTFIRVV